VLVRLVSVLLTAATLTSAASLTPRVAADSPPGVAQRAGASSSGQGGGVTVPAQPSTGTSSAQKFTGSPVSLDFEGADLRAVLRTFAEISGLNVVIDPAVRGTVDVAMRDVPWDQALDVILRANRLGYVLDGTIVRVAPLSVLADEEKARRKLAEEQALSGELRVSTRTLNYARAEDVAHLVTRSVLTSRGTVQVDARTNTLVLSDLQAAVDTALAIVAALDAPEPQVEIEARIVQTSRDFARAIGVQWGLAGRVAPELGNTAPLAFPNGGSLTGRRGVVQGPSGTPTAVDLGVGAATSAVGLALGAVNGAFSLDVALTALERAGHGRLLSTPRVATQNNVEAEITQGVQIPIQTVANNTVTVTFKDAALSLRVTPQITGAGTVIMKIVVENASPDFSRAVGTSQIPPIDTQRAMTQVLVNDGQTTVIGGIYVSRAQTVSDRTPVLHRLPLFGWLFRRDATQDESRELLIFITPRIVRT
jgi:type IV pilus assembly protein PilQ